MYFRTFDRPVWAEIDLAAIAHNIRELRRATDPKAKLMAVVKANAYGHGAVQVSQVVLRHGADYLGVAILEEARQLREAGIDAPILILGYTPSEQAADLVNLDITQTIYDYNTAAAISQAAVTQGKMAKVHIKVDTGMGRIGFASADTRTPQEILNIAGLPGLEIEGMFTHFAVAEIPNKDYTYWQYKQFMDLDSRLQQLGLHVPVKHSANSAAILELPDIHLDMVRAGISVYGLDPSHKVNRENINLRPALSLKTRIAHVKTVPAGVSISYGRTFTTARESVIATIPVGYADGYTRLLSNKTCVLAQGRRVPQIGNICMDQFMIDGTDLAETVKPGDEVVLIGRQKEQEITVDELAGLIGTINYEIICMISDRVPRVYINE